ncbi:Frag1/DRAM/Sfk1 [Penicillium concentricum]|uniref:Frag1/DRAM/Sfk1 n=1 Tax=Penicillium concentricum TaxID=293559 RepID=A0A9W9RAE4_9EURO|nr:Frag1/DRAM/Sfk1 [Penicillium concentricum]KAJ5355619.1 Frag1/DRAM/Sfk1 [Penicillium concentricum]
MWILSFWLFPVISGCMWLATLIAMMSTWAADGKPRYITMDDGLTIPYISHIGAEGIKPLFIAGSAVTVVFMDLGLLAERWLRHAGQLAPNKGRLDKACAIGSILFSIAGAAGLILLSIFDTKNHHSLHNGFLGMFIGCYVVCALLVCLEYIQIGRFYHPQARILIVSFAIKALFVVCELAVAIAFGVCMNKGNKQNAAAVLEWVSTISHVIQCISSIIVLGITAWAVRETKTLTVIFSLVVAVLTLVVYGITLSTSCITKRHRWHVLPMLLTDAMISYLWLTAFIFLARDFNQVSCKVHLWNKEAVCSRKYTVEAFSFIAFFTTFVALVFETLYTYKPTDETMREKKTGVTSLEDNLRSAGVMSPG